MRGNSQLKRKISVLSGFVLLIIGIYATIKFAQAPPSSISPLAAEAKPPRVVVQSVDLKKVYPQLAVSGKVVARNKIEVFAEITGTLLRTKKPFRSGTAFSKGEILLQIDRQERELSIAANKQDFLSELIKLLPALHNDYPESYPIWKSYVDSFSVTAPLRSLPETRSERERYYLANTHIHDQYLSIRSSETNLNKYTIRAPFDGVVSQGELQAGTLIRTSQKLGEYFESGLFELSLDVPTEYIPYIHIGSLIQTYSTLNTKPVISKVDRIGEIVNDNTQTVTVYSHVQSDVLQAGLSINATIALPPVDSAFTLRQELLIDKDQILVVRNNMIEFTAVDIAGYLEDQVILRGIPDNEKVVDQLLPGAYRGMPVEIAIQ